MKRLILIAVILLLSSSITFAQDICESDFTCDGDVDSADVATFLEDFGRSEFFNPCPPCAPPVIVLKTGQTVCYDGSGNVINCTGTGQDGEYQTGNIVRFTDNGDGTVTDSFTGLIWMKDANCFGERTWDQALSDCNGLADGSCGLTDGSNAGDWRLPNIQEIKTLANALPLKRDFTNVENYDYWSSTTWETYPTNAHTASFLFGQLYQYPKPDGLYVWCVRGGH